MSFVKTHYVNGRKYFSISESYRDGAGKVHHRYLKYLGSAGSFSRDSPSVDPQRPRDVGSDEIPGKGFLAEEKYDGVRTIAYIDKSGVAFVNRRGVNKVEQYPEFQDLNEKLNFKDSVVLDGETIAFKDGVDDFRTLATRDHLKDSKIAFERSKVDPLTFVAFDVVFKDGRNLMSLPLEERKKVLNETIPGGLKNIREIEFSKDPAKYVEELRKKKHVEGVVFKKLDSPYVEGKSGKDWKKLKFVKENDVVVLGFTPGTGKRKDTFGALIIGTWNGEEYVYSGKVGTGFSVEQEKDLREKMDALKTDKVQVDIKEKNVVWVKPELVGRVKFLKIGSQGSYREPSWQGIREDIGPRTTHPFSKQANTKSDIGATWRKEVNGVEKQKIWDHYDKLWDKIKPQVEGRYVTVRAYHGNVPVIMRHFPGAKKGFIQIRDKEDLKELVRLHAFEIIPELSTIKDPNHTDRYLIDLDIKNAPSKKIRDVIKTILEEYKGLPEVKNTQIVSTGHKGYHVWGYLKEKRTWNQARNTLKGIQRKLYEQDPSIIELNIQKMKSRRKPFIFPDISSVKRHGAARAIGSLHGKTLDSSKVVTLEQVR